MADGFESLTVEGGATRLTWPGWAEHAVNVIVDGEAREVPAAVVRTSAAAGAQARRLDAEREQQWCDSFREARGRLAAAGIYSETRLETEPGVRSVPLAAAGPAGVSRNHGVAKQREHRR